MKTIKPLLPSLKEKKRYVVFEILSSKDIELEDANIAIKSQYKELFGEIDLGFAGLRKIKDQYKKKEKKGIMWINHKYVDKLRYSMSFIEKIGNKKVIVRTIGSSGIIKKAKANFMAS